MQRITITIDDDLLALLDALSAQRGYQGRSEAIRDVLRRTLAEESATRPAEPGFGVLSYVYEHETRELAGRLAAAQHDHHALSVATMHVHLNHDDCLEIAVLKGAMGDIQRFAAALSAERGVRYGQLHCIPAEG